MFFIVSLYSVDIQAMKDDVPPSARQVASLVRLSSPSYAQSMQQNVHDVELAMPNRPATPFAYPEGVPHAIALASISYRAPVYGQMRTIKVQQAPAAQHINSPEGIPHAPIADRAPAQQAPADQQMQDQLANNERHATLGKRLKTTYNNGVCKSFAYSSMWCCVPPVMYSSCCIGYLCCNNKWSFDCLVNSMGKQGELHYDGLSVVRHLPRSDYPPDLEN